MDALREGSWREKYCDGGYAPTGFGWGKAWVKLAVRRHAALMKRAKESIVNESLVKGMGWRSRG